FTLLGLPFVHIVRHRRGGSAAARMAPIRAWIASGPLFGGGPTKVYGVVFAKGRMAFALLSLGWLTVGVMPIGLLSIGLLALGVIAVGGGAVGWAAIGRYAVGVLAAGEVAAHGLWAWARSFASGAGAFALHVDDNDADLFFKNSLFFRSATAVLHSHALTYAAIFLMLLATPWRQLARLSCQGIS